MDFLFRVFTPWKVILFIALLGAASLARHYEHDIRAWYFARYYPSVGRTPAAGQDISAQWDEQQSREVVLEYQKVCSLLGAARESGFKVDGLKAEADAALSLNTPAYRRDALETLSKIEFSIPQKQ